MEIITASYALPMTNGCPIVENGAIAVEFAKILAFGPLDEIKKRFPDVEVKEHANAILMPGLVDSHCHLDLVGFFEAMQPGESQPQTSATDFAEILISSIDYKHDTKPETMIDWIQKGIGRLIETGVTCVGDMTHFEGTFKILREMGLRAIVFPEILAGRGEVAQQKFEIALALVEKYTDATHDRVQVGLGPYAPYLLSRNLLKIISQHAREATIPLAIHAAESFAEMEFFFDSQGSIAMEVFPSLGWNELPPAQRKTPIEYLSEIGFLEAPTTIVGALHLSAKDFSTLARHLSRVVWCPSMNKFMKHGNFPYTKLVEHGVPIGFGTEYWQPRRGYNMWEEMRLARSEINSVQNSSREILKISTIGGARALGLDHRAGTLEEGKKADYIIVDATSVEGYTNPDSFYTKIVSSTEPHHVKKVVTGGNILKSI